MSKISRIFWDSYHTKFKSTPDNPFVNWGIVKAAKIVKRLKKIK